MVDGQSMGKRMGSSIYPASMPHSYPLLIGLTSKLDILSLGDDIATGLGNAQNSCAIFY